MTVRDLIKELMDWNVDLDWEVMCDDRTVVAVGILAGTVDLEVEAA